MIIVKNRALGWKPDLPDRRDKTYSVLRKKAIPTELPPRIDLRPKCSPVEDQGQLGSCTANSAVACLEYLDLAKTPPLEDLSRIFLYYHTRVLEGTVFEDSGATLRNTIKAASKNGVCREKLWPYAVETFTKKPNWRAAADARKRKVKQYGRLDTVDEMRACLAEGFPFVFGFSVYDSFMSRQVEVSGVVPMPNLSRERVNGGHAVTAVGYDDDTKQFIVRNSWGVHWGALGYCYMPYELLSDRNLSDDFWTIRS